MATASSRMFGRNVRLIVRFNGDQRTYEDFFISFEAEKNSESTPNPCKITIANLNNDSRTFIERRIEKTDSSGVKTIIVPSVELQVGYGEVKNKSGQMVKKYETIYRGNIGRAYTGEKTGPDLMTNIECGDGQQAYKEATIEKSYAPGTSLKDVITDTAASFGKTVAAIKDVGEKSFKNGLSLSGLSRDVMDRLVGGSELEWSIQDDAVQVVGQSSSVGDRVVKISQESGLIGSPSKGDKGIKVRSLLQPKLKPGSVFNLVSRDLKGDFRVRKITHKGDNKAGDFFSEIEAVSA